MHRARAFFYVCAGAFLLALSYHLGARSATAQAPAIEAAGCASGFNAVVGRTLYTMDGGGGAGPQTRETIPGTATVLAAEGHSSGNLVLLANGDCYQYQVNVGWVFINNLLGPTPAQRETFCALKSRYRNERGAAQPTTQDR